MEPINVGGNVLADMEQDNMTNSSWELKKAESYEAYINGARSIQFVMCSLFAGIVIQFGSKKYHYPYTVGCFLFGVAVGLLDVQSQFVRNFTHITRMNPSDMMLTFLPILVFESSFGMDAHMFYRALVQCLTLAIPGLVFCTVLTGVFAKYALYSYGWSWYTALLFGCIVSATDPVAVVALLKDMRMPHSFTILIEGESLLNDGVAIVLYETLSHYVISSSDTDIKHSLINLAKTCFGAPVFGYGLGKIAEWMITRIYISPVSEMTTTLILAYITYFVAERFLGISAVLAVVLYGVTLNANKMAISPESESLIHTDWRLLSVYANTLIFVIVGILVSVNLSRHLIYLDILLVMAMYAVLTLLRGLMIAVFFPLLKRNGYGLTWKEGIVLAWGGLRGAVGLALALMFVSNPKIDKSENASKVLVQVSGIIILTLLVNANSIKFIMKLIRFQDITLVHRLSMGNAISCVTEVREKSIRICKRDWKYRRADWMWLLQKTKLPDPYKGGLYGDDPSMCSLFIPFGTCDECLVSMLPYAPTEQEMEDLSEAARKKVLRAMKGNLWKQFRSGLIQRRALKTLSTAADNASDVPKLYLRAEDVSSKLMAVNPINRWLGRKISALLETWETPFDGEVQHLCNNDRKGLRKLCLWIYLNQWFEVIISTVIILNLVHVCADIYYVTALRRREASKLIRILCINFVLFFISEIFIKVVALHWKNYIRNSWNKFDFLLTLIAIVEGGIDFVLVSHFPSYHGPWTHFRIIIVLRLIRILRTLRVVVFALLSSVRHYASAELYYAYDIGRGFLFTNEAILKKIDAIVDFGPCSNVPITICKENIEQMLLILMKFEEQYPAVSFALKSNRAARRILNRVDEVMGRFKQKSLILREDMRELRKMLFTMTKRVVYAPIVRPLIRDVYKILEQSDWIREAGLMELIRENHVIFGFKCGWVVQAAGQRHRHVYIVASGIVNVVGERGTSLQSQMYYQLPNTDTLLVYEEGPTDEVRDYLVTSQTIGLLGYLQKTKSVTTAVCQKDCELIQISYSLLKDAEKDFNVTYAMWRFVAINIATIILKKQPRYKEFSSDDIKLSLQKAILPSMQTVVQWEVPSIVDDMVMVQGQAKDEFSSTKFIAPCYIPSTYKNLVILDDVRKRPPVIILLMPDQKYKFHLCRHWTRLEDIAPSGLCSEHRTLEDQL